MLENTFKQKLPLKKRKKEKEKESQNSLGSGSPSANPLPWAEHLTPDQVVQNPTNPALNTSRDEASTFHLFLWANQNLTQIFLLIAQTKSWIKSIRKLINCTAF